MISQDAKTFLLQANQLQENFSRLITVNNLLKEAKIDLSALDKRLGRYDNYFDKMLETAPVNQDWNFILKQLEDNVNELNTYFGWINDVEKYDIQKLGEMILSGEIKDGKTIAAVLKVLAGDKK